MTQQFEPLQMAKLRLRRALGCCIWGNQSLLCSACEIDTVQSSKEVEQRFSTEQGQPASPSSKPSSSYRRTDSNPLLSPQYIDRPSRRILLRYVGLRQVSSAAACGEQIENEDRTRRGKTSRRRDQKPGSPSKRSPVTAFTLPG